MTIPTPLASPVAVPPTAVPVTMVESSSAPVPTNLHPRKLKDDDDDDDYDHALLQGGPFENAKRKCSWSATSMRKELGSPRMANSDHSHAHASFSLDGPKPKHTFQHQTLPHQTQSHGNTVSPGGEANARKERPGGRNVDTTFLQELGSALVSCSGGGSGITGSSTRIHTGGCDKTRFSDSTVNIPGGPAGDLMTVANSWVRLKDSFQKAVKGDLDAAKEAWRKRTQDFPDNHAVTSVSSHDSILTFDNQSFINQKQAHLLQQEEEAMQLRRLTSWGTVGTYETAETSVGTGLVINNAEGLAHSMRFASSGKVSGHAESNSGCGGGVVDNDGVPIDDVQLLHSRGKKFQPSEKSNKMTQPRRKRVVRFDYPPISSLRECPRTQPEEIEDLFFTEHELEQIEDDRYSTISADDVEIVAISTSTTVESESCEDPNSRTIGPQTGSSANCTSKHSTPPVSASSPRRNSHSSRGDENNNSNDSSFRNYVATPSKQKKEPKKGRRPFAFDDVVNNRGVGSISTTEPNTKKNSSRRRRSSSDANANHNRKGSPSATSGSSRRMIKSVQIYLRERSVG